jgi:hypothetical protein
MNIHRLSIFLYRFVIGIILVVQVAAFEVFVFPSIIDNFGDNQFCNSKMNSSSYEVCQSFASDVKIFQDVTGVEIDAPLSVNLITSKPLESLSIQNKEVIIDSLSELGPFIIAYKALYGQTLDRISFVGMLFNNPDVGGFYHSFTNQIVLNYNSIAEDYSTVIHEYGHAASKFTDATYPIRSLQYFFGDNLERMKLVRNMNGSEYIFPWTRNYLLADKLNGDTSIINFSSITNLPIDQRIQYLQHRNPKLTEVESVMMELFCDQKLTGIDEIDEYLLRKIVLLSNGNPTYLDDRFLKIMAYPLGLSKKSMTLVEYNVQLQDYFNNQSDYTISPRLTQYYQEATELRLFRNLSYENLINKVVNNLVPIFFLNSSLGVYLLVIFAPKHPHSKSKINKA